MKHLQAKHIQRKFFALITILLTTMILVTACVPVTPATAPQGATRTIPNQTQIHTPTPEESASKVNPLIFQQAVRKLWEDHITWTRVYIISALADLPETEAATQRLLQNQVDIGNAIVPFYGNQAGEQLTALLQEHILIAADLLSTAKSGDTANFEAINKIWYENGDQIASFLHSANPEAWSLNEMQTMLRSHLDLTLEEATARLTEDWAGDVAAYEKVHEEILMMADMLANGIIQQFPDKFVAKGTPEQKVALALAMDKLWEDHVTWTRVYMISVTSGLADTDTAARRLLQNQTDIGDAIKPLYGDDAGNMLTSLLKDHILIAADLLAAAKLEDKAKLEEINLRWYDNADQIASFLSNANSDNWTMSEMQSMMKTHLDLTLEEAFARLEGDWSADVAAYDKVHDEILEMSSLLTEGIVAQFPDNFK